jgi:hypothetical protein
MSPRPGPARMSTALLACLLGVAVTAGCASDHRSRSAFCRALAAGRDGFAENAPAAKLIAAVDATLAELPARDRADVQVMRNFLAYGANPSSLTKAQAASLADDLDHAVRHLDAELRTRCGLNLRPLFPLDTPTTTRSASSTTIVGSTTATRGRP